MAYIVSNIPGIMLCNLKKKELTPSNSTVHYVSIIKIFLVNGIQAVLEYGVGIRTTPKNIKYFRTL